ncbi:hypothetical protein ACJRO7_019169 [Eucalyptus globulus]|uniref:Membrane-associated kinase regulator 6 n=1 Tax=Eucalyptus globulus TaxID=34317 RepID=A0ABD3KHF2_EUCGL
MESTKPLAIDSFSYSWLSNVRTSFDGLDESLRPSSVDSESYTEKSQSFNFNVSLSQLSPTLLHADELFADGIVKPFFAGKSANQNFQTSNSLKTCPTQSLYSFTGKTIFPAIRIHWLAPARLRKSSVQTLRRCIAYLRPSCFKSGCGRKSTKADADRRFQEHGSWICSPQPSQPQSSASACVTGDWSDTESSIYEAILHCKRCTVA